MATQLPVRPDRTAPIDSGPIDVIATTMSGSLADQRKVGRIGPTFQAHTSRPVRVHTAASHDAARAITRAVVAGGGRTIVSAGGAGTFNAVLEGAHQGDAIGTDVRLAFLRKGSADLIGKVLGVPDELEAAVEAIVGGIEADRCHAADVLLVETSAPDGAVQRRHMVGFGGLGGFGEVPRFTESRLIKLYKGVLGSLFGDLGPFLVGMTLAMSWWQLQRLLDRVPPMTIVLDDDELAPEVWGAVIILNGDLGDEFPLGRGLALDSGSFRVVVLRYRGLAAARRQIRAARKGWLLNDPDRYDAVVATVRQLMVRPASSRPYLFNLDGLRLVGRGEVRVSLAGRVWLVRAA